jgi:hypothetical protein
VFSGSVSVVGTRPQSLTCADVGSGAREEIVAGRYTVIFALDRRSSQTRIAPDSNKLPITSRPLALTFDVTSTTHERVRRLAPVGDGTCTETFRDCDRSESSRANDTLDVFTRGRRVVQQTPGDFIATKLRECAETPEMRSLLPDRPLDADYMSEDSPLRAFRHRDTVVTHSRDLQLGDGSTSVAISGELRYARSIRACTKYPGTRARCRTARG